MCFCLGLGSAEYGKRTVKRLSKGHYAIYKMVPKVVEFFVSDIDFSVITDFRADSWRLSTKGSKFRLFFQCFLPLFPRIRVSALLRT